MIRERDVHCHCGPQGLLGAPMLSSWSPWQRKPQGWTRLGAAGGHSGTCANVETGQPPATRGLPFSLQGFGVGSTQGTAPTGSRQQALRSTTCPPQGPSLSTGLEGQGTFQCLGPERAEDPDTQEQHAGL